MIKNKKLKKSFLAFMVMSCLTTLVSIQAVFSSQDEKRGGAGVGEDEKRGGAGVGEDEKRGGAGVAEEQEERSLLDSEAQGDEHLEISGMMMQDTDQESQSRQTYIQSQEIQDLSRNHPGNIFQDGKITTELEKYWHENVDKHNFSPLIELIEEKFSSEKDESKIKQDKIEFVRDFFVRISAVKKVYEGIKHCIYLLNRLLNETSISWKELMKGAHLALEIPLEKDQAIVRDEFVFTFIKGGIPAFLNNRTSSEEDLLFEDLLKFIKHHFSLNKEWQVNLFGSFFRLLFMQDRPLPPLEKYRARLKKDPPYSLEECKAKFNKMVKIIKPSETTIWEANRFAMQEDTNLKPSSSMLIEDVFFKNLVFYFINIAQIMINNEEIGKKNVGNTICKVIIKQFAQAIKSVEMPDESLKDKFVYHVLRVIFFSKSFVNGDQLLNTLWEVFSEEKIFAESLEDILKEIKTHLKELSQEGLIELSTWIRRKKGIGALPVLERKK